MIWMQKLVSKLSMCLPLVVIALQGAEVRAQVDTKILFQTPPPLFLAPGVSNTYTTCAEKGEQPLLPGSTDR